MFSTVLEAPNVEVKKMENSYMLLPHNSVILFLVTLYACKHICYDTCHNGSWVLIDNALTLAASSPSPTK